MEYINSNSKTEADHGLFFKAHSLDSLEFDFFNHYWVVINIYIALYQLFRSGSIQYSRSLHLSHVQVPGHVF